MQLSSIYVWAGGGMPEGQAWQTKPLWDVLKTSHSLHALEYVITREHSQKWLRRIFKNILLWTNWASPWLMWSMVWVTARLDGEFPLCVCVFYLKKKKKQQLNLSFVKTDCPSFSERKAAPEQKLSSPASLRRGCCFFCCFFFCCVFSFVQLREAFLNISAGSVEIWCVFCCTCCFTVECDESIFPHPFPLTHSLFLFTWYTRGV